MSDSQLLENLRNQVLEYQQRIDEEEITDQDELDNYFSLLKLFNRTKESANRAQAASTNKCIEEEEIDRMFGLDDWSFEDRHERGEFDHLPPAAVYHRELIVEDPEDRPPRPTKICLCIPNEPEKPKLAIPT